MLVVVAVGAAAVTALAVHRGQRTTPALSASAVWHDARSLYEDRVRVEDRVTHVVSATAVALGGRSSGAGGVLVLGLEALPAVDDLGDDDRSAVGDVLAVEGVLRAFDIARFEKLVGELDDSRYRRFVGHPALVAEVVEPAPDQRAPYRGVRRPSPRAAAMWPPGAASSVEVSWKCARRRPPRAWPIRYRRDIGW